MSQPVDHFQLGYAAYPERGGYPEAGTQAEADWLAGWYRKQRELIDDQMNRDDERLGEHLFGRATYFANYGEGE